MSADGAAGDFGHWLAETREWADRALEQALADLDCGPKQHEDVLRYALFAGGKRLRPALVRMAAEHFGGAQDDAAVPAAAVEMIHTYSLVHDDLPCMDDDELRRGRPTTHTVYGEADAVLCGDGLQALAFDWLATRGGARAAEMVRVLAAGAGPGGMVGGQVLDLASGEAAADCGAELVRRIHGMKTAALIAASLDLGAIAAGADRGARGSMRAYGLALGCLFQAVDDVLDVVGDAPTLGKTPGKDAASEKATLVAALGLDGARRATRELAEEAREHALAAGCAAGSRVLLLVDHFQNRSR
ncbi:MAG: polyprenyl synthetase family protein [bacterium]|nr:polyprenyl synthetase family protein [bacterium]